MRVFEAVTLATIAAVTFACGEATAPAEPISFVSLNAGYSHTCGLAVDGQSYCWGSNAYAQLGGGPKTPLLDHLFPLAVTGGVTLTALFPGGLHTCALDAAGTAYCWGANQYGQLATDPGHAQETCRSLPCVSSPTATSNALQFLIIAAGMGHTCALTGAGTVYCWGDNHDGQLGDDSIGPVTSSPTRVKAPNGVTFVALGAGQRHTCALSADGQAYCWGQNNWGQVGPAAKDACVGEGGITDPCSKTPVLAGEGLTFVTIGGGWGHTCALVADGATYCWGYDGSGQLGVEPDSVTTECPFLPSSHRCSLQAVRVSGDLALVALAVGGTHNCGLLASGEAYCWGGHLVGQLGDCSVRDYSSLPRPVCGHHRYVTLSAGSGHTCAIALDHRGYCWGPNDSGQLGSGTLTAFGPVPVGPPTN
jgi:alpha-tubulin suppressor-like RCC1 family protein